MNFREKRWKGHTRTARHTRIKHWNTNTGRKYRGWIFCLHFLASYNIIILVETNQTIKSKFSYESPTENKKKLKPTLGRWTISFISCFFLLFRWVDENKILDKFLFKVKGHANNRSRFSLRKCYPDRKCRNWGIVAIVAECYTHGEWNRWESFCLFFFLYNPHDNYKMLFLIFLLREDFRACTWISFKWKTENSSVCERACCDWWDVSFHFQFFFF